MRLGIAIGLAALAAAAAAGSASAQAFTPPERSVTYDGATGRFLMNGPWLMHRDPKNKGLGAGWFKTAPAAGWSTVTVPNASNARDFSAASMGGSVTWYRRDFRLPDAAARYSWLMRFESTRYRVTVWLNGQRVGGHEGGYVPFEVNLANGLSRTGVNRVVVRVDNRQRDTDLPVGSLTVEGKPNGGWWNYGGLLGDVYLRRVDGIDMPTVQVLPHLACRTCQATIEYRVTVQNYGASATPVTVTSSFGGQAVAVGTQVVDAGKRVAFRATTTVAAPHLWSPLDPYLYPVSIAADGVGGHAGWTVESGIRSVNVVGGRLLLNWLPVNFRGGFFHEDSPTKGGAADPARMQLVIDRLKQVGGTVLRTHYPLDPYLHQLADREGVMIWSEIPVFQVRASLLKRKVVQTAARRMLQENILDKSNHPSVFTWSVGNELDAEPGPVETAYYKSQAKLIRALDPTRPTSVAILGYPNAPCTSAYAPLDLLGVNTYFGWYPGPDGTVADRTRLSPYLEQLRHCYPRKAIAVTEFGAEANRHGPRAERGTYEFQSDWNDYTLGVFAQKPWLSGALGMLMNFHARPSWAGGNPHPSGPMHAKGIFDYQGNPKPAAAVVSGWYHSTQQYDLTGP